MTHKTSTSYVLFCFFYLSDDRNKKTDDTLCESEGKCTLVRYSALM